MSSIEEEIRGVDTVENSGNKRIKKPEERDYISRLPDSIIHHILSLLPSTKQAIRTGILSKRWRNQWIHVPILVFQLLDFDRPYKTFSIIENVLSLNQCPRIKKFECFFAEDGELPVTLAIHFATERNVEDLILGHCQLDKGRLPILLFNNGPTVRLKLSEYQFEPSERVKWECLKILELEYCSLSNEGIENALSGSPVLETLQLTDCDWFDVLVIASKSLRNVIIDNTQSVIISNEEFPVGEILCPNLGKLHCMFCRLSGQVIQNISYENPLLEALELCACKVYGIERLAISSKSLKRLALCEMSLYNVDAYDDVDISQQLEISEISCPELEELLLYDKLYFLLCAVINCPSLVYATLSFQNMRSSVQNVLQQLKHVKELTIWHTFLEVLPNAKSACLSFPLSINSLILEIDCLDKNHLGIVWALRSFHVLKKLAIKLPAYEFTYLTVSDSGKNYWDSFDTAFSCLVSHLRIVKIFGFSPSNGQCKIALNFIEFLLKNGRVLEKVVVMSKYCEPDFKRKVYRKLLSFDKCSKNVVIELS